MTYLTVDWKTRTAAATSTSCQRYRFDMQHGGKALRWRTGRWSHTHVSKTPTAWAFQRSDCVPKPSVAERAERALNAALGGAAINPQANRQGRSFR